MVATAIIVGTANAVRDALGITSWTTGLDICGAGLIGAGDVSVPVLKRAPVWDALDVSDVAASTLVLAEAPTDGAAMRGILARAADAQMKVLLIEDGAARRLRLDDLVGRPIGAFDWDGIRSVIADKRILITGGGGSIGSELARQIGSLGPKRLTLLDSSEYNLHRVSLDLPSATIVLADIRDPDSMRRWFAAERPELVFHSAALKQVPLVERFPREGVLTNVFGLRHVAEAAHEVGADLIFVSTDKAVDPSGAMGATKRLGEIYCQALDRCGPRRAIPVRLGNVLGSAGSVLPIFEAQLAAGGPLTVTDAAMTRYFVTIPQAARLLLQAAAAGLAGDGRGAALVIDMGEPLPVVELARRVIQLEGLRPDRDAPVVFTGLRPGEKLHEALIASSEWRGAEPAPGVIAVESPPRSLADVHACMERLERITRASADDGLRVELFAALVGEGAVKPTAVAS